METRKFTTKKNQTIVGNLNKAQKKLKISYCIQSEMFVIYILSTAEDR